MRMPKIIEAYLIDLNKKVLIISRQEMIFQYFKEIIIFGKLFFGRTLTMTFSMDQNIFLKDLDVFVALIMVVLFFPIYTFVAFFIILKDGFPFLIKQNKSDSWKMFQMYKFRTMKNDSHTLEKI